MWPLHRSRNFKIEPNGSVHKFS
ncbi:hypothetical protein MPL3365_70012 [Mesorhizobium plurifarium]|uniref:Uncharacterized protein n=1 Tax=Mesorhizobium plurifarium TaxID=69974 RepID=A0A090GGR1_MESPL|nr:hypothetical protein MPL3365_70012 [Mesorhizobium plurifarium]